MKNLISLASQYKYNSLQYVDSEDIINASIYINTDQNLFLYQNSNMIKELYWDSKSNDNIQLFWASNSKDDFFEGLIKTLNYIKKTETKAEKLYTEFIPEDFLDEMIRLGFKIVSEWTDFWNRDLNSLNIKPCNSINIRHLNKEEIPIAANLTRSCAGYSRGFTGQSDIMIKEWIETENSYLFVAELGCNIVGLCFVALYGFDSEEGTVLWIRELAVDPNYQSRGIGRELISYGIKWGRENGAKRSFLACDAENYNAIKLYESLNYSRNNGRGQINMEIEL